MVTVAEAATAAKAPRQRARMNLPIPIDTVCDTAHNVHLMNAANIWNETTNLSNNKIASEIFYMLLDFERERSHCVVTPPLAHNRTIVHDDRLKKLRDSAGKRRVEFDLSTDVQLRAVQARMSRNNMTEAYMSSSKDDNNYVLLIACNDTSILIATPANKYYYWEVSICFVLDCVSLGISRARAV